MSAVASATAGQTFPPGTLVIRSWHDALLRNLIDAPPDDGAVHPLWALTGALRGLGTDIDGILSVVGFTAAQGPLFAGCDIEYDEPLAFDIEYTATGHVIGLEPKVGRRTGPFDLYTFALDLEREGVRATRVTFAWVLPRRGAA